MLSRRLGNLRDCSAEFILRAAEGLATTSVILLGVLSLKSLHPKEAEIVAAAGLLNQVGHYLPHHAAELEAMPGKASGDPHALKFRMSVQDKMLVGSIGE